jgi:hypothetical protein
MQHVPNRHTQARRPYEYKDLHTEMWIEPPTAFAEYAVKQNGTNTFRQHGIERMTAWSNKYNAERLAGHRVTRALKANWNKQKHRRTTAAIAMLRKGRPRGVPARVLEFMIPK